MSILRRFLVLQMLLLWQGGFVFYSAVVVPIGTEVLGRVGQGFITQQVTIWLNIFGGVALAAFAWDSLASRDPKRWRKLTRVGIVVLSACFLAGLHFWLHSLLTSQLDFEDQRIARRTRFYENHWWYLMISTAHWLLMLAFAWLSLAAWRAEDRLLEK